VRLIESLPFPPLVGGLVIAAAIYGAFLLWTVLFGTSLGRLPDITVQPLWIPELILAVVIGMAPAVTAYTLRGTARDVEALGPVLQGSDAEHARLLGEITSYRRWIPRLVGALMATGGPLLVVLDPALWTGGNVPDPLHPTFLWVLARNVLHIWLVSRAACLELMLAQSFSSLAEHLRPIDLLDPGALRPFERRGLRSVLLWMVFASLHSLLYLGDWAADALVVVLLFLVAFAGAAFLLPVMGAHRRIREAKGAELARVRAAIHRERGLAVGDTTSSSPGKLGDLVAYEARIRGVSEWPFDAPTVLRFLLYLGIGLGSWLGGALVERALDVALD
jgi:hypothetical protein